MKQLCVVTASLRHKIAICAAILGIFAGQAEAQLGVPPTIAVQPLGVSVLNGGTVVLTTTAVSLTSMSFNWMLNGQPVSTLNSTVVNVVVPLVGTVSTLTINNAIPAQSGNYSVQVVNGVGSVTSSNALVTVAGGITVDRTTSAKSSSSGASSLSWPHSTGSGTNGLLIVNVSTAGGRAASSVSYGGTALTRIGYANNPSGSHVSTEMWYLKSPSAGTSNIVVTLSSKDTFTASATTFFGVSQTLPFGSFNFATGTTNRPNVTVASATGELMIDTVAAQAATSGSTVQNALSTQFTGSGSGDVWGSTSFRAGAFSVPMVWTLSGSGGGLWVAGALSLKPATSSSAATDEISLDNISSANSGSSGATNLTWSHTTGAGASSLLLVSISTHSGIAASSVTYGGFPLSRIGYAVSPPGIQSRTEMWYLKSPVTGTADISVTLASKDTVVAGATTFFGVNQTVPLSNFSTNVGSSFAPTITISANSGATVVDAIAVHQAISGSPGVGQTSLWNQFTGNGGGDVWGSSSIELGAATNTLSWNLTGGGGAGEWAACAVVVNHVATGVISYATPPRVTSEGFSCQFSGPVPATYIIYRSTNCVDWVPFSTNVVLSGTVDVTDPTAANRPAGFYRVEVQ